MTRFERASVALSSRWLIAIRSSDISLCQSRPVIGSIVGSVRAGPLDQARIFAVKLENIVEIRGENAILGQDAVSGSLTQACNRRFLAMHQKQAAANRFTL